MQQPTFDSSAYDQAARALIAARLDVCHAHALAGIDPAICPACEAGDHDDLARVTHEVFACACPCNTTNQTTPRS